MPYRVREETFESIGESWQRLLPNAVTNTIFVTPLWAKLWWDAFGEGSQLRLWSLWRHEQLLGIAPLRLSNGELRFLGDPRVCDYGDFIVARGAEAHFYRALLDHLERSGPLNLHLQSVPGYSPTLTLLTQFARLRRHPVYLAVEDVCPQVELPPTWDQYLMTLTKKDRHELRRKLRRLHEERQAQYTSLEGPDCLGQNLDDFLTLMRRSRPDKATFMDPDMERFFRAMAAATAKESYLRLCFLEIDGARTAASLAFAYDRDLLLYNSGFDPSYSALSVGWLQKALCLREALESGKRKFDMLRGAEEYKYDLGGKDLPIFQCWIGRTPSPEERER